MPESTALRAAVKGLSFALLTNAVFCIGYVIWIWDTVQLEPVKRPVTIYVPGKVIEQILEQAAPPDPRFDSMIESIHNLRQHSVDLSTTLSTSVLHQASVVSEINQKLSLLQHHITTIGSRPEKEEIEFDNIDLTVLGSLLNQPSISTIPSMDLENTLNQVLEDLEAFEKSPKADWAKLDDILNTKRVRDDVAPRDPNICPEVVSEAENNPEVARQSHINAKLAEMKALLERRNDPNELIKTLKNTPDIVLTLEEDVAFIIQNAPQPQLDVVNDDEGEHDVGVCVDSESVLTMVQGALNDSTQMNEFLTRIVQELDPNETNLIFDARLSASHNAVMPFQKSVNLRHLLDSGVTKWTAKQLDRFLDSISGYNDFVDGKVDQLLEGNPDSTLGQILMSHILELAGVVSVPNFIQTKAGLLLE